MGSRKGWLACLSAWAVIALVLAACGSESATPAAQPTTAPVPSPTPPPRATPVPTPTSAPPTSTPTGPQPRRGGILKNRAISDWANWDSYDARASFSVSSFMNAFSNLMVFSTTGPTRIEPDLAERWEVTDEGRTVTFFLRKGVKWHDGRDLTAADVAWNFQRALKGEGTTVFNKSRFAAVTGVTTPDDFTVRVALKQPSASFVPHMATPFILVYAPHAPPPQSNEFKSNAVGSGPFKVSGYAAGVKYEFVANPNYYKKDEAGRPLPYLDGVTTFILPVAAGLAAFRSKQLDCGCVYDHDFLTPNQDILEKDIPGVKLTIKNSALYHLQFNQKPPWTDVRVRRGVFLALDRLTVKDLYRQGRGFHPPTVLLSPDLGGAWGLPTAEMLRLPGFRLKDGKKDPADLDLARQLFREAGFDLGSVSPVLPISQATADVGEVVQGAFQLFGMKVSLKIQSTAEATDSLRAGQFDIAILQGGNVFDDPSDQPPRFLLTSGPENYGKWQRPEIDALFQRIDAELDLAKRRELAYEFQRRSLEEAVATPLQYVVSTAGTHAYVFGFTRGAFTTHSGQRFEAVWIDDRLR